MSDAGTPDGDPREGGGDAEGPDGSGSEEPEHAVRASASTSHLPKGFTHFLCRSPVLL
jgi:hypothetical protein